MTILNLLVQNRDIPLGGIDGPTSAFQPGTGPDVTTAGTQLELFLSNILALITVISGLAFVLYLIFGAMQWIMAAGDEGRLTNARKQITNGALGLVITLVAYSIMTVVSEVLGVDFLNINTALGRIAPV